MMKSKICWWECLSGGNLGLKRLNELKLFFRHVIAILHFNENLQREKQTGKDGKLYYNVIYPKFKHGEETVKEVAKPPTYCKWHFQNY